jgi:hypothetical protein
MSRMNLVFTPPLGSAVISPVLLLSESNQPEELSPFSIHIFCSEGCMHTAEVFMSLLSLDPEENFILSSASF